MATFAAVPLRTKIQQENGRRGETSFFALCDWAVEALLSAAVEPAVSPHRSKTWQPSRLVPLRTKIQQENGRRGETSFFAVCDWDVEALLLAGVARRGVA